MPPGASTDTVSEMITGVAAIGVPISSGDVLYTVESRPVVALEGELPAWRTMNRSSDDGADIEQLEAALVALGYDPDGDVTVDASWDSDTTAMVKRWQVGLGADDTGVVTLGSVVFIPQAATVTSASARVGDEVSDGDTVLELSGTAQQVIIDVPIELRANVIPSMRVDLAGTPGTVTRLRSVDGTDGVTVQAVISPDAKLDVDVGSTIKVTISYDLATGQLVVPTDAVVSRLDGTYALQILDDTADPDAVRTVVIVAVWGNRTAITGDGLLRNRRLCSFRSDPSLAGPQTHQALGAVHADRLRIPPPRRFIPVVSADDVSAINQPIGRRSARGIRGVDMCGSCGRVGCCQSGVWKKPVALAAGLSLSGYPGPNDAETSAGKQPSGGTVVSVEVLATDRDPVHDRDRVVQVDEHVDPREAVVGSRPVGAARRRWTAPTVV